MTLLDKRFYRLILASLLCLLLTGCVDVNLKFVLQKDGSGTLTWEFEVPRSNGPFGLTAAQLKADLLRENQFRRAGVTVTESRTPNGNEQLTAVVPFRDVSEISGRDFQASFTKLDGGKRCLFSVRGNNDPLQASLVRMTIDVEMPGKIIKSNADTINDNRAHFGRISPMQGIYVESEIPRLSFGNIGVALGVGILLTALIVLVALQKRRRQLPEAVSVNTAHSLTVAGTTPAVAETIYCGDCGTPNKSSSKYCRRCGVPLSS